MVTKSLGVLGNNGAGKKTLIGSLIYKLPQLEELERKEIQKYAEIVPFYEERGRAQSFYAPSGLFTVEKSQAPDVAFWVVDASDSANWELSVQNMTTSLSSGALQPRDKLIILVNKMDLVNWSRQTFEGVVRKFNTAKLSDCTYIIPISSLQGENILETPKEPSWIKDISVGQFGDSTPVSGEPLMSLLG
ncbi:Elongation factor 1-alpha [Fusarium oxysporum f. sp. raphani]|uniref:Elongation factor 1-alpha n=1 Tax=Fusarium oxysporum f. sp. raphani TaxID=96318 RepID=A0A8J5PFB3_FUSOX|nr:Elongation factor 1-alpha [Fusarium oxysporum f. sp. raphani]